ncbi:MAG TPA: hypothetical protein VFM18_00605 [Methanosarcina sp.]|nr:hypothetical protein [Methanosarcina sp.]
MDSDKPVFEDVTEEILSAARAKDRKLAEIIITGVEDGVLQAEVRKANKPKTEREVWEEQISSLSKTFDPDHDVLAVPPGLENVTPPNVTVIVVPSLRNVAKVTTNVYKR